MDTNIRRSHVLWLTGLSGAGKTTIARALETPLTSLGHRIVVLDGDCMRQGLCSDLGFTAAARDENVRRVAEVAKLFFSQGCTVIVSLISPMVKHRAFARSLFPAGQFTEAFVECPHRHL